jgi:hypothetical protein
LEEKYSFFISLFANYKANCTENGKTKKVFLKRVLPLNLATTNISGPIKRQKFLHSICTSTVFRQQNSREWNEKVSFYGPSAHLQLKKLYHWLGLD